MINPWVNATGCEAEYNDHWYEQLHRPPIFILYDAEAHHRRSVDYQDKRRIGRVRAALYPLLVELDSQWADRWRDD